MCFRVLTNECISLDVVRKQYKFTYLCMKNRKHDAPPDIFDQDNSLDIATILLIVSPFVIKPWIDVIQIATLTTRRMIQIIMYALFIF